MLKLPEAETDYSQKSDFSETYLVNFSRQIGEASLQISLSGHRLAVLFVGQRGLVDHLRNVLKRNKNIYVKYLCQKTRLIMDFKPVNLTKADNLWYCDLR